MNYTSLHDYLDAKLPSTRRIRFRNSLSFLPFVTKVDEKIIALRNALQTEDYLILYRRDEVYYTAQLTTSFWQKIKAWFGFKDTFTYSEKENKALQPKEIINQEVKTTDHKQSFRKINKKLPDLISIKYEEIVTQLFNEPALNLEKVKKALSDVGSANHLQLINEFINTAASNRIVVGAKIIFLALKIIEAPLQPGDWREKYFKENDEILVAVLEEGYLDALRELRDIVCYEQQQPLGENIRKIIITCRQQVNSIILNLMKLDLSDCKAGQLKKFPIISAKSVS